MLNISVVFFLLVLYQVKHFLADYPMQNSFMLGKFKPGWEFVGPLSAHAAAHGVLTWMIAIGMTHNVALAGALMCFDATVHFFMDRLKAGPKYMGRWKAVSGAEYVKFTQQLERLQEGPNQDLLAVRSIAAIRGEEVEVVRSRIVAVATKRLRDNVLFWWALGVDQMVHHLTHYVCVYFILRALAR